MTVNGSVVTKPREKVIPGQQIDLNACTRSRSIFLSRKQSTSILSMKIDDLLVINKPAGFSGAPWCRHARRYLVNALLHHCPQVEQLPRAGIVHRISTKTTTGLMVVAKNIATYTALVAALQARDITREYEAVAIGVMTAGGSVDAPIGRQPDQTNAYGCEPKW